MILSVKSLAFFPIVLLFAGFTQLITVVPPGKANDLSIRVPSDTVWFPHLQIAKSALQKGDIETACRETDIVLKMADACGNKLPPGPLRRLLRSNFSDYIREFAVSFQDAPAEIIRTFGDPPLESWFYEKEIAQQQHRHLEYATKLYRKAVDIEVATGDFALAETDVKELVKCLRNQDKAAEAEEVLKGWDQSLAKQTLMSTNSHANVVILSAQAERLEQEHKFVEAEQKLKSIVQACEKKEHLGSPHLAKLLAKNTTLQKRHAGAYIPQTCGALSKLAGFYQRTGQCQKEEVVRLRLQALDAKILPADSYYLCRDWRCLSDCYKREHKLNESALAAKKGAVRINP